MSAEEGKTNSHNYKFEIERTDSLEFTRNSETNEPFEGEEEHDELTMLSASQSHRRSTFDKRKEKSSRRYSEVEESKK